MMKIVLSIVLAIILLIDNVTTWVAVQNGAYELNPIVKPFLNSLEGFTLFTIIKCLVGFLTVYYTYRNDRIYYLTYMFILVIFVRAIVINVMNSFV